MPLVTTKDMFAKAYEGGYAIGAFNVNNMETIQGIVEPEKNNRLRSFCRFPRAREITQIRYILKSL